MVFFSRGSTQAEIKQREFEQMLTAGDVTDVSLVNDRWRLRQEAALQKPEYSGLVKRSAARSSMPRQGGPQFKFRVVDGKVFKTDFDKLQESAC
jgi:cell division protease FtsH